jgi:predicted nuclease of predicted toxin-antitoxin system
MQFKIDENLPVDVADLLRQAGYDALTLWDQHLVGSSDQKIAEICQHERRCLITLDKDFADIRSYPPQEFTGIMILRLQQQDMPTILTVMKKLLALLPSHPLDQHVWIVEERRVRIRGATDTDIIQ